MESDGILSNLEPPGIDPTSSNPQILKGPQAPFSETLHPWDQDQTWAGIVAPHTLGSCLRFSFLTAQRAEPSFLADARSRERPKQEESQSCCLCRVLTWMKCWAFMGRAKPVGPAHPSPLWSASPSLGLSSLEGSWASAPNNEKDCVTGWRGRRQRLWAHRWHSPWGWRTLLGQSTHSVPSVTDSQDGRDLTVLPCSLSCSHLSQMLQGLTLLSGHHSSSFLKPLHEACPESPTPSHSWRILARPLMDFVTLIMTCTTLLYHSVLIWRLK